jgi:hypothetical protein
MVYRKSKKESEMPEIEEEDLQEKKAKTKERIIHVPIFLGDVDIKRLIYETNEMVRENQEVLQVILDEIKEE